MCYVGWGDQMCGCVGGREGCDVLCGLGRSDVWVGERGVTCAVWVGEIRCVVCEWERGARDVLCGLGRSAVVCVSG